MTYTRRRTAAWPRILWDVYTVVTSEWKQVRAGCYVSINGASFRCWCKFLDSHDDVSVDSGPLGYDTVSLGDSRRFESFSLESSMTVWNVGNYTSIDRASRPRWHESSGFNIHANCDWISSDFVRWLTYGICFSRNISFTTRWWENSWNTGVCLPGREVIKYTF
jgi:hypothetical protein